MNKILCLILLLIPLLSCQSSGQKELPPREMNVPEGESTGKVGTFVLKDNTLSLPGEHITIRCPLDTVPVKRILEDSERFEYQGFQRPDGPVRTIFFTKEDHLTAWIGDGIRSGMGPEGLQVLPGADDSKILLLSDNHTWDIPVDKEKNIDWNGERWVIYVSGVLSGALDDQPAFAADIIILRQ